MTRPYGKACVTCRRLKIKCVDTGIQPGRCDRCVKLNKTCIFEPPVRRRGTKQDDVSVAAAGSSSSTSIPQQDLSQQVSRLGHQRRLHGMKGGVTSASSSAHNTPARSTWQQPLEAAEYTTRTLSYGDYPEVPRQNAWAETAPERDASASVSPQGGSLSSGRPSDLSRDERSPSFLPPFFVSHTEDTRTLSIGAALDPDRGLMDRASSESMSERNPEPIGAPGEDDPIFLRIINRPGAQMLFDGYFAHFEYNVGFLDPQLYTFNHTREASSFLFTVLLLISSRVFRPDLHPVLRDHAEKLLGRVLLSCDAAIENIWGIMCMYYWKETDDRRGYALSGFAMRLAAASEWNGMRRRLNDGQADATKPGNTESRVRQRRDQDRVWMYLGSLERTICFFTDRPFIVMFPEPVTSAAAREWIRSGSGWNYGFGDTRAVAGHELSLITKPAHEVMMASRDTQPNGRPQDGKELDRAIAKMNTDLLAWAEYWAPRFASHQTSLPCLESQIYIYRDHIHAHFNTVHLQRILTRTDNDVTQPEAVATLRTCYASTLRLLRETIVMGRMDMLYYMWDTGHLMIAYSAMLLLKLLKLAPDCPGLSAEEAYSTIKEVADLHAMAAVSLASQTNQERAAPHARARNTVDAQARLLRAIASRLKGDLLPSHMGTEASPAMPFDSYLTGHGIMTSWGPATPGVAPEQHAEYAQPTLQHQHQHYHHQPQPQQVGQHPSAGMDAGMAELVRSDADADAVAQMYEMAGLTQDMDISLDSSFMDSRFMDMGFMTWDQPGIFRDPR